MGYFKGQLIPVQSGNIAMIGMSEGTAKNGLNVLRVVFNNGRTYDYEPVPKVTFEKAFKSPSVMNWFTVEIKNNKSISFKEVHNENNRSTPQKK